VAYPGSVSSAGSFEMEDAIRKAGLGDDHAMRVVWRAHQPLLVRYLRARLGSDDADDISQQVWIEIARALPRFEGNAEEFRRLLFSIGHRRMIDEFRRRERRAPVSASGVAPDVATVADFDGSDDLARAVALVRRLPPDQADAVLLRIIADLDVGDVAAILGKREGNVRVLVHRGLEKLGELLQNDSREISENPVTPGDQPSMNGLP
jgi:RNA polymerase sigma-70 factor, ECF subfamily